MIMIDLRKDEIETLQSEKLYAPSRVDDMMKSISKLENSNVENFNIIKPALKNLISKNALKKYKANKGGSKVLLPLDEAERYNNGKENEGDIEESKDDDQMSKGEIFCTYAQKGRLDKIKA